MNVNAHADTRDCAARFLTVAAAAERLSVSNSMIRKMIHAKRLASVKIGSDWRILASEVDELARQARARKV